MSAIGRENITWRSWWDGGSTGGPIARSFAVRSWPTIYIIDHRGIICYKNLRGPKMDAAVELLLMKAEAADESEATAFPVVGPNALQMREWTDKSGDFSIMAAFVKFKDGKAHLEKEEDGQIIEVPMSKLCDDDQKIIREKLKAKKGGKR